MITNDDLEKGNLIVDSKIKADKIFSASKRLVRLKVGEVKMEIHEKVLAILHEILERATDS